MSGDSYRIKETMQWLEKNIIKPGGKEAEK